MMKETFQNLIAYLKNPVLEKDSNESLNDKFKIFFHLLIISLITSVIVTPFYFVIEELNLVKMDTHKVEEMFNGMGILKILLIAAIITAIIKELIFRVLITAFKKPESFKQSFYTFSITFGIIHIFNFEITTNVLLLIPLLVLPQLLVGTYFGYIQMRFGILWSMLLHRCYNYNYFLR